MSRNDDLVAPSYPGSDKGQRQGGGTRRNTHTVGNLRIRGERPLKRLDFTPEDEGVGGSHSLEGSPQFVRKRGVLSAEINKRHHMSHPLRAMHCSRRDPNSSTKERALRRWLASARPPRQASRPA